jgi:PIN domain nuclease of toxin-antitoxin system
VILLLDAHALLWWMRDVELADATRASIASPLNDVLVSAATVWELEIKRARGQLQAPDDLVGTIEAAGFSNLPILGEDGVRAGRLPLHHRDPFDRMLVAQAARLGATIVSRDRALRLYDVPILPA